MTHFVALLVSQWVRLRLSVHVRVQTPILTTTLKPSTTCGQRKHTVLQMTVLNCGVYAEYSTLRGSLCSEHSVS